VNFFLKRSVVSIILRWDKTLHVILDTVPSLHQFFFGSSLVYLPRSPMTYIVWPNQHCLYNPNHLNLITMLTGSNPVINYVSVTHTWYVTKNQVKAEWQNSRETQHKCTTTSVVHDTITTLQDTVRNDAQTIQFSASEATALWCYTNLYHTQGSCPFVKIKFKDFSRTFKDHTKDI